MSGYLGGIAAGLIVLVCAVYLVWKFRRIVQGKDTGCPLCEYKKNCPYCEGKPDSGDDNSPQK